MNIKAIIFDKDGTLLDFDSFWVTVSDYAIREILKSVNKPEIPVEEILSALGVKNKITDINEVLCHGTYSQMAEIIYDILKKYDCTTPFEHILKLTVDSYHNNSDKGIVKATCNNMYNILLELKNMGIKLAIVTTDAPVVTQKCLKSLGIDELFDVIYTDDGKTPTKPDPYCILDLCKKYNLTTSDILMVGDTMTDMNFAKNGGVKAIGVAKSENNKEILKKHAHAVIPDISHIFEILKEDTI